MNNLNFLRLLLAGLMIFSSSALFCMHDTIAAAEGQREYPNRTECCGENLHYWYLGGNYSVPFMFGDMNSLTSKRHFWGNHFSLKSGYKFSPIFALEATLGVGRMRGFSPESSENFRLGHQDAMTYYPYTILGGKDNYAPSPDNAGIWEKQGNNIYIESSPYSELYTESRFIGGSLQGVFNLNRLFMKVPEYREQKVSLFLKPGIYLHKFFAQARTLKGQKKVSPRQSPLSVGIGGDVALNVALSENLALELSSGLIWESKREFDGIRTIRRSHDDYIWNSGISLFWKFRNKKKPCEKIEIDVVPVVEPVVERDISRLFRNGNFAFDYLLPDMNIPKEDSLNCQVYLNYELSKWEILPHLVNNQQELQKIENAFREIESDLDKKMTHINIDGFASPEGPHNFNVVLSKNRAMSLSKYIIQNYAYPGNQIFAEGHAEDWDGLAELLQNWNSADKAAAMAIVASDDSEQMKKERLKQLPGYRKLLTEIYPMLRRNTCTFHYSIVPFSVNRAAEVINTHPEKLNAGEMVAVANGCPLYSAKFNHCVDVAFAHYPSDPIVRIYKAAIALYEEKTETAEELLKPLKEDERAWNLLGVVAAMKNDVKEADFYFSKAMENGDMSARNNLNRMN